MLVVEDERRHRRADQTHARARRRHDVEVVGSGDAAVKLATEQSAGSDHPRPQPAGSERSRSVPAAAHAAATKDVPIIMLTARGYGKRPGDRARRRAPTTTSPSRSACASSPRACAPCCAGARRRARPRPAHLSRQASRAPTSTPSTFDVDGEADPADAARVRAADATWWRTATACCRATGCSSVCGATTG